METLFLLHWDEKSLRHLRQVDGSDSYILLAKTLQNKLTKNSDIKHTLVNVIPELRKICQSQKKEDLFKDINSYLQDCYTQ